MFGVATPRDPKSKAGPTSLPSFLEQRTHECVIILNVALTIIGVAIEIHSRSYRKIRAGNLWLFSVLIFNLTKDSAICGCRFGTNEGGNHEALVREACSDEAEAAGGCHRPRILLHLTICASSGRWWYGRPNLVHFRYIINHPSKLLLESAS